MSQHEDAPEEFVSTFNNTWDIGIKSAIGIAILLLAMFFYALNDSWGSFFGVLILAAVAYGAWRLFAALFIGPGDPDKKSGH